MTETKLILVLIIVYAETKKPPGYIEPPKVPDPNPPNYEYGYSISDEKGDGQGKQEQRDGIYALGRYYVQGKDSSQNVQYFADDWGYHPVVEYGNVGPHSRTSARFALGEEAVKQLQNKENNLPQLQGIIENADKFKQPSTVLQSPPQPQSPRPIQSEQLLAAQQLIGEPQVLSQPQQQTQIQPEQELGVSQGQPRDEKLGQQQFIQPQGEEYQGQQRIEPEPLQIKLENQSQPQHLEIQLQQQQSQPREPQDAQAEQKAQQEVQAQQDAQAHAQHEVQALLHQQFQQHLENQPQQQQFDGQDQSQELHILPQQQTYAQSEQAQSNQVVTLGEEATQHQELYQQYQPQHQIYIQQPQAQQQLFIQHELQQKELAQETSQNKTAQQEHVQQVLLRHEEPKQKLIFPQEKQGAYEQFPQQAYQKEHPRDNIIFQTEGIGQQLVYVQEQPQQQSFIQPLYQKQQSLIQNNVIHTQGHLENQQHVDTATNQYETAALYENPGSKLINTQQQSNEENKHFDESNVGGYGSKINSVQDTTNKLIEHTKNLVTGEDVLNINEAISKDYKVNVESSTPNAIVTEYVQSHLLSGETIANVEINQSNLGYLTTTISPVTEASLNQQPIVVAELEDNASKSTSDKIEVSENSQEEYSSTSKTSIETVSSGGIASTSPSTVLVTPRPVSTSFLAPITAGIQLQNIELHAEDRTISGNQNYNVEIQKSLPYYLGKFEYPSDYGEEHISVNNTSNIKSNAEIKATEDIELGKTLLFFPGQDSPKYEIQRPPKVTIKEPCNELNNQISIQHIPSTIVKEKFFEYDQQPAQGYQHQVVVQHLGLGAANHFSQKPTEVTKVIHKPYPVKVPYEVPYPVVKPVQVPVTVQKIVEKPVHITKYIEKPVPVPQPYPVEKIVEKPIHVPVQVTKYIDRPYPVEVRVPYLQPYPVEKVVQRIVKQPYPVEVRVPIQVEKIVEKKVPVPHYIERPVEKIVEKPVPHYVDRPYPVEVKVPVPQPYLVRVEVPKPYPVEVNKFVQKPYATPQIPQHSIQQVQAYPVQQASPTYIAHHTVHLPHGIQVGAPLHIYSQTGYSNKQEQHAQQSQQQTFFYANPYAYAPQINHYLPPKQEIILNHGYLPAKQGNNVYLPPKKDCDQQKQSPSINNYYYAVKPDDYVGLLPPKETNNQIKFVKKQRTARSNFDDKSVRMEYGFLPPLIPSLEIDEQGNPIEKGEK